MAKRETTPQIEDDVLVKRGRIQALADPPMAESTFHDRAKAGQFVRAKGMPGYYLLNATRVKLGMLPVDINKQPECQSNARPSERTLLFFALSSIVKEAITLFPDEDLPDQISVAEQHRIQTLIERHGPDIEKIKDPIERLHYIRGALEAMEVRIEKEKE